jgi:hypothetical protein
MAATPSESPLDRYARLRPGMIPKEELAEGAFTSFVSDEGKVYRLSYVMLEWPEKAGEAKYTGTFALEGDGYSFNPGFMVDSITNLWYANDRLEVDCWALRIVASRYVKNPNGTNKKFNFHLSIGTDGIIVTGDEFDAGLLRWTGDGFMHLEIPSGKKVEMQSVADPNDVAEPKE